MAMTRKEQSVITELQTIAALRWSDQVPFKDVPHPKPGVDRPSRTTGYDFNVYDASVTEYWSTYGSHGTGKAPSSRMSGSQGARDLYSTRSLALRALRYAVARKVAEQLADIDRQIAGAEANERGLNL